MVKTQVYCVQELFGKLHQQAIVSICLLFLNNGYQL